MSSSENRWTRALEHSKMRLQILKGLMRTPHQNSQAELSCEAGLDARKKRKRVASFGVDSGGLDCV